MKIVVDSIEKEGLEAFLGKPITVWCLNYIYTGTLVGINQTCIKLDGKDACVVYETGELTSKAFRDAQPCGKDRYVMISVIESFEAGK